MLTVDIADASKEADLIIEGDFRIDLKRSIFRDLDKLHQRVCCNYTSALSISEIASRQITPRE